MMSWYYDYDDDYDYEGEYEEIDVSADALVIEGPVQAVSKRGDIGATWWAQQWVAAMMRLGDARLDRGKRYARNGSVLDLTIQSGIAYSLVQGHYSKPYQSIVELGTFTEVEWEGALDALAGQAIYAAKLLSGEMPNDIEGVFQSVGLSLFPRSRKDIGFECSCPDWGNPCKHCAAVYYLVAEQLDVDPFILFHLRGRTREQVLDGLRRRRGRGDESTEVVGEAVIHQAPPLDANLSLFWTGDPTNLVRTAPAIPDRPPMLAQLGAPPAGAGKELEQVYDRVSKVALAWLGQDD
ncbi:MAG: SWIM zinc finger family protein [Anaerolineae bacterium]|nr:SWIM zinc finger family protein [Anaerolineae bacterium]